MSDRLFEPPPPKPVMSEKELQNAIIEAARLLGWKCAHFRSVPVKRGPRVVWETPVQADGAGFPDLILVRGTRLIWAELKSHDGKLTAAQEVWRDALRAAGQAVYIWRPTDWLSGGVDEVLKPHHDSKEAAT